MASLFRAVILLGGDPSRSLWKANLGFWYVTLMARPASTRQSMLEIRLWTMFRCRALQRTRLDKQMPICQTKNISKDQLIDAKCVSVNEYSLSLSLFLVLACDFLLPSYVAFTLPAQIIKIISKENLPKNYVRLLNYFGTEQFLFSSSSSSCSTSSPVSALPTPSRFSTMVLVYHVRRFSHQQQQPFRRRLERIIESRLNANCRINAIE